MSVLKKIIGFIPTLLPIYLLYIINTPWTETEALGDTPFTFPWYIALWIAVSLLNGVLLCIKK